ncbi:hypothetical protein PybrP1_011628, partial [[Pythium] brassicae (nom. inval.)]
MYPSSNSSLSALSAHINRKRRQQTQPAHHQAQLLKFFTATTTTSSSDAKNRILVDEAVKEGQLGVLQWLLPAVELPDYLRVLVTDAAMHGHLEIVRSLDMRLDDLGESLGSLYAGISLLKAVQNGHLAVAKYLVGEGHQILARRKSQLSRCARHGNLEMVQWLHAQRLTDGTTGWIDAAAPGGHLHIVQW